jgi:uncharacterized OB-fold protein
MTATARPKRTLRDEHDRQFWVYCAQGELRVQRCAGCGKLAWPVVSACPRCGNQGFVWQRLSGRGQLRSYCIFERQYYPECPTPWTVLLVELEEGPLFISNPHGIAADALREGMNLRLDFIRAADAHGEFNLPVFGPA